MTTWDQCHSHFFFTTASLSHPGLQPHSNAGFSTPVSSPSYSTSNMFSSCSASSSSQSACESSTLSSESKKMRSGGGRRYKTPSPQLLRSRRNAANERERRRMFMLNLAYDKLRTVLPEMDAGHRLSKYETLMMAQQYIEGLAKILNSKPVSS